MNDLQKFCIENREKIYELAYIGIRIARDGISSDYTRQDFFEMIPDEFRNIEINISGSEGCYWVRLIQIDGLGNVSANEAKIVGIRKTA